MSSSATGELLVYDGQEPDHQLRHDEERQSGAAAH